MRIIQEDHIGSVSAVKTLFSRCVLQIYSKQTDILLVHSVPFIRTFSQAIIYAKMPDAQT